MISTNTQPCRGCGMLTSRRSIIADDIENPKPYCKPCHDNLILDVLLAMAKEDLKKIKDQDPISSNER